jgi:uncharacterized membrane protein YdjX (TVP38/TMEM64 family)
MTMSADDRRAAMPAAAAERGARVRRLCPIAAVMLVTAVILIMGWHRELSLETLVRHHAAVDDLVTAHYPVALLAFVVLYAAVVSLSVPGAVFLTISGGILFGAIIGGLAAIIGATIGATIVFLIARTAGGDSLVRHAGPRATKLAAGFRADAFSYLLFLRLVPVFPFWLVNLAPALVGVPLGTFVAATALGIVPGTFAYALVGAGLESVVLAQEDRYNACFEAGRSECRLDFDMAAAVTPELLAAIAALGVVALIPVVVRRLRARAPSTG